MLSGSFVSCFPVTLDGIKRRKNLKGGFAVPKKAEIDQRTISLVDDVLTLSAGL